MYTKLLYMITHRYFACRAVSAPQSKLSQHPIRVLFVFPDLDDDISRPLPPFKRVANPNTLYSPLDEERS